MVPTPQRMVRSVAEMERWVFDRFRLRTAPVAAILGIGCISRYKYRGVVGFDLETALRRHQERHRHASLVGCYMDGEVGVDRLGRPIFSRWSLSELVFADDVSTRCELYRAFDALAPVMKMAREARSISEAIQLSLGALKRAGYIGGMVSLIYRDGEKQWVKGQCAFGRLWDQVVRPATNRLLAGNDILAIVAKRQVAQFVRDAQHDDRCNRETAVNANVASFYAYPLVDRRGETIGIIQFDLGDMRHFDDLPHEQQAVLNAVSEAIATWVTGAMESDELALARKFDELTQQCLACSSVADAVRKFARSIAIELHTDFHVRLRVFSGKEWVLRMVDGDGPYFEIARSSRLDLRYLDTAENSPTAVMLRNGGDRVIVNETIGHETIEEFWQQFAGTPLEMALRQHRSFATFRIGPDGEPPIGTISFSARSPWFFNPSLVRSLYDIGPRLAFLVARLSQLNCLLQLSRPIEQLDKQPDLQEALLEKAKQIHAAFGAANVSIYVIDETDRRRTRDRQSNAQFGESSRRTTDRADQWRYVRLVQAGGHDGIRKTLRIYTEDHALVHFVKQSCDPARIPDTLFDANEPLLNLDILALPLWSQGFLHGFVLIYGEKCLPAAPSTNALADKEVLRDAAIRISDIVERETRHQRDAWDVKEREKRDAVQQELHNSRNDSERAIVEAFARPWSPSTNSPIVPSILADQMKALFWSRIAFVKMWLHKWKMICHRPTPIICSVLTSVRPMSPMSIMRRNHDSVMPGRFEFIASTFLG